MSNWNPRHNRVVLPNGTVMGRNPSRAASVTGNVIPMGTGAGVTPYSTVTPPYTLNKNRNTIIPGFKSAALAELRGNARRRSRRNRKNRRSTRRNRRSRRN